MKHTKLFIGALLMMATLIACETALPPVEEPPTPPPAAEAESRNLNIASSTAACIQPTISLGAVTVLTQSGEPKTTAPGINDLIRVEVTADAAAPNYMWGRVRITDSGGTTREATREVTYLFYPNASTAGYGKPAHYVRGPLAEGRTVSFEITEAHVFRSGDNCFSTDASTVRTALPEPAEVAPTVIAGAGDRRVPPTTGGVERSVAGSGRMHWARLQWKDADTPMNPPVWLYRRSGLYADGKWHALTTGGLAELYVTPIKLGMSNAATYDDLGAQTCRLFADTGGRVLRGEFLNHRPSRRWYRLDRIVGTQASPHVFTFDQWNDTLVVNGGQTLNVAMICRDSWQGEAL